MTRSYPLGWGGSRRKTPDAMVCFLSEESDIRLRLTAISHAFISGLESISAVCQGRRKSGLVKLPLNRFGVPRGAHAPTLSPGIDLGLL